MQVYMDETVKNEMKEIEICGRMGERGKAIISICNSHNLQNSLWGVAVVMCVPIISMVPIQSKMSLKGQITTSLSKVLAPHFQKFVVLTQGLNPEIMILLHFIKLRQILWPDFVIWEKIVASWINCVWTYDEFPWSICFNPKSNTYILSEYDKYMLNRSKSAQTFRVFDHLWIKVE